MQFNFKILLNPTEENDRYIIVHQALITEPKLYMLLVFIATLTHQAGQYFI